MRLNALVDRAQRTELEALRNKEAVHRLFAQQLAGYSTLSGPTLHDSSPLTRMRKAGSKSLSLSISPNRIREIHDPCSRILNQLHKILFISQLPPAMEGEMAAQRQVIDRYKRELFSHRNHYRGWNLKDELHKLVGGSQEVVQHIFYGNHLGVDPPERQRITYEELQRLIEQVQQKNDILRALRPDIQYFRTWYSQHPAKHKSGSPESPPHQSMEQDFLSSLWQVLADTGYYSLQGSAADEPPSGPSTLDLAESVSTRIPPSNMAPLSRPPRPPRRARSPLTCASSEQHLAGPRTEAPVLPEPLRVLPTISHNSSGHQVPHPVAQLPPVVPRSKA